MTGDGDGQLSGPLPTFLIIGAMKAGTTSLYHYVRSHPQVFMPAYKAPEFFAREPSSRRGIDWYRRQFADAEPEATAVGEASNVYTKYPRYDGVPERVAKYIPDVRLVYIVRDPIERIRSHYQTRTAERSEKLPFERAVFENPIYLNYSRYFLQIEQYLKYFGREQLLVVTSEDLRQNRGQVLARVYGFLGVDPAFVPTDIDREFYRTQDKPVNSAVPLAFRKALKRHVPPTRRFKELEANVVRKLRGLLGKNGDDGPVPRLTIPEDTRERLRRALGEDVQALRGFMGADFDGWGIA